MIITIQKSQRNEKEAWKKGTMALRDKRVFCLNFHKVQDKILMLNDKLNLLQAYSMTDTLSLK